MISEDYVSFEVAKLLKEKGFSENTICKYADVGGIIEKWYDDYRERVLRFNWDEGYLIEPPMESKDQYEIIGDTILAPTHQMAMKWLREVHKLFIVIEPEYFEAGRVIAYDFSVWCGDNYKHYFKDYPTFEEAVEAALKHVLENLI